MVLAGHASRGRVPFAFAVIVPIIYRALALQGKDGKDCRLLPLSKALYQGTQALFNPAAAYDDRNGWVMILRYDHCYVGEDCSLSDWTTRSFFAHLGDGSVPDTERAGSTLQILSVPHEVHQQAAAVLAANRTVAGDSRPFFFNQRLYLAHWWYSPEDAPPKVLQGISRVDTNTLQVQKTRIFRELGGKQVDQRVEKNCAWVQDNSRLLLFYKVLPTTAIYSLLNEEAEPVLHAVHTLQPSAHARLFAVTELNLSSHVHNSGHPVRWPVRQGQRAQYFAMVHQRVASQHGQGNYTHWGVRIDRVTMRVTSISSPVISAAQFKPTGFKDIALIVGSYHILPAGEAGRALRLFFGLGDKFSCAEDIPLSQLRWHLVCGRDYGVTSLPSAC